MTLSPLNGDNQDSSRIFNDKKFDEETIRVLADAVTHAIGKNDGGRRFLDLERIPLICLVISNMGKSIEEIKQMILANKQDSDDEHEKFLTKESFDQQFKPLENNFRWIVMGVSGAVGIALLTAIFSIILK